MTRAGRGAGRRVTIVGMIVRTLASSSVMLLALGCGPQPKGGGGYADPPDPAGGSGTVVAGPDGVQPMAEVTATAVCDRIFELKAGGCERVSGFDLDPDECVADYTRSLEERGPEARQATQTAGHCLLDFKSCAEVSTCFGQLDNHANNGAPEEYRACAQTEVYAPVGLSRADWARRKGAGVERYRKAATTKDDPIAVCGIPAEMTWLLGAVCDDGSRPFEDAAHAHAARVANVGPGGACGSIIDLYEVPCPEGTYAIYIDAYVCPVPDGQPVPR